MDAQFIHSVVDSNITVKIFLTLLKEFSKCHKINNPQKGTLKSIGSTISEKRDFERDAISVLSGYVIESFTEAHRIITAEEMPHKLFKLFEFERRDKMSTGKEVNATVLLHVALYFSKDRVNTLLLVATLIATVTFAAGFTMPGGYSNSEPDKGKATLLNKLTFQMFVICDTIAMYCAIMVAVTLIWAQLDVLHLVSRDSLYRDTNRDECRVLTDEERVALVKQRLEERVLVNDEGNTALHEALLNDYKDIAEYLIKENVEAAYYVNNQGKSPLYMAVAAGNTEYVNNILNGISEHKNLLHEQLVHGKSLPHAAIMGRNIEKEPMLILLKDDKGLDPLEFASSIGFLEGVNFLQNGLKNPIQLRIEDIKKSECWEGRHKRLKQLQDAEKVEISEEAPTHGSDPHFMNLPLYIAAKKGNIDGFIDALDTPSTIYNQMTPLKY
ncbi:hypothetical protein POM88_037865 [Heracleum sosnowskyi]|uniref:PGG domain-containing protein n=1 Tax=Heracleum sosnowskyi TaxID=360622 RepID=A0AAD8HT13_9APIA|nr:hypothetical protein POM88_037865 [Heracleum sosnowskyi]